jgi:tetraprenyl-beta-curcumene synthase
MIQSASQSAALARATLRELTWGLREVSRQVDVWQSRADAIPDPALRADALQALTRKRGNINGAALFWTLPDRRERELLRVLVAYEILADFLDCTSERGAQLGIANGRQLHLALLDALDPDRAMSDYYRYHHSGEDSGYLVALVRRCRVGCTRLGSYEQAKPLIARASDLTPVLALNHEPDPSRRRRALTAWAAQHPYAPARRAAVGLGAPRRSWFEQTAGASGWLTVLAMLALAGESPPMPPARADMEATYETYLTWIAPTSAMLDSYSDIVEDRERGDHSYIGHYPSLDVAVERMGELVRGSCQEARALPKGSRHAVITACMIAFYLSKDSVCTPTMREHTRRLRQAGGPLVTALVPTLRLWRTAHGQRAA